MRSGGEGGEGGWGGGVGGPVDDAVQLYVDAVQIDNESSNGQW